MSQASAAGQPVPPDGLPTRPPQGPPQPLPGDPPRPPAEPTQAPPGPPADSASLLLEPVQWRRLSPRMLLIHPVRETARALPALAGLLIAGTTTGQGQWWALLGIVGVVAFSFLRWFTTRFRITTDQVQLRTGLFQRRSIVTPADRVRSVDVTASALHRLLGLAKVQIGTGDKDSGLELDSLTAAEAGHLRAELLHRARPARVGAGPYAAHPAAPGAGPLGTEGEADADTGVQAVHPGLTGNGPQESASPAGIHEDQEHQGLQRIDEFEEREDELVRLDPGWIRFAPFTASGLVTAAATLGIAWRVVDELFGDPNELGIYRWLRGHLETTPVWLDVVQAAVVLSVLVTALSVGGYVLSYWGFRLTRHSRGTLHTTRGLLTTRATSIEERRLRGVELNDTLLLRAVRGARLEAVTTGLSGPQSQGTSKVLVPPAPLAVAREVARAVLGDAEPLSVPLTPHGPAARRRRYIRSLIPVVVLGAVLAVLVGWRHWPSWLLLVPLVLVVPSVLLAADRYRSLGHAVTQGYLVAREGSVYRSHSVLAREGIIGWNLDQTWFQRRAGLATLVATTAAGDQAYAVLDVPAGEAVEVARSATPGLLDQFLQQ